LALGRFAPLREYGSWRKGRQATHLPTVAQDSQAYLMLARYYSAGLSRFLSADPDSGSPRLDNPQSWNRYAYALNNPLKYVDPDGEKVEVPSGFSSLVSRGLEDSRTFSKSFNRVDQNTRITATLHFIEASELPAGTDAFTEITPHTVQAVNTITGQVTQYQTYSAQVNIPEGISENDQIALIAHELHAVHEKFMGKSPRESKADKVQGRVKKQLEKKEGSPSKGRFGDVQSASLRNPGQHMQQRISGVCTNCI